ncbi:MAG TPA: hypothetical protein VFW95_08945 [Candidatus Limnocylindria bacterium]|nr:hypothetical protein [Candidatus Limnocylindria bacterium]
MTHERIENALSSEIPGDERRYIPRPIPATIDAARAQLDGSPGMSLATMLGAAVALAVVAVVAWAAWRTVGPERLGVGAETPSAAAVPSPSPTPSGPLACGAADFLIASDPWDAAAGSRGTRIVFRVVESTPSCLLPAAVDASITDASGVLVSGRAPEASPTEVTAGTQVELGISWSNWCGPAPAAGLSLLVRVGEDSIPIGPAGDGTILVPPCLGSGQPSALNVTGFQPSERPPIGR